MYTVRRPCETARLCLLAVIKRAAYISIDLAIAKIITMKLLPLPLPSQSRFVFAILVCLVCSCMDPGEPGNLVPQTVEFDATLPRISINGTLLHAQAFGNSDDPMIMVLHGGPGGDHRALLPYKVLADDGYYLVFWDQRGAGLSQRHPSSTYTFETYLSDLTAVIEHYSRSPDQSIVFFGHSWGAMYATWFINENGDYNGRIAGAILSEPGAFTSRQLEDYLEVLEGSIGFTSELLNDFVWADQFLSPGDHQRADYKQQIISIGGLPSEHGDQDNPEPSWRSGAIANRELLRIGTKDGFDWTTNLSAFPHKVLFLRGERNENMPLSHQQQLADSYPNAEIITIPDTGHYAIWDKQPEFLSHTRRYLAERKVGSK